MYLRIRPVSTVFLLIYSIEIFKLVLSADVEGSNSKFTAHETESLAKVNLISFIITDINASLRESLVSRFSEAAAKNYTLLT